jgi:hypothetical protein
MTVPAEQEQPRNSESGVVLLMALAFIFAIGMVVAAIATFATTAYTTSYNLSTQRATESNAESAATIAVSYIRSHFVPLSPSTPVNCMPPTPPTAQTYGSASNGGSMTVTCTGTATYGSAASRDVNFYVCPGTGSTTSCAPSAVLLFAEVVYDDVPPNAAPSADTCTPGTSVPNTCGVGMTVDQWDVRSADN